MKSSGLWNFLNGKFLLSFSRPVSALVSFETQDKTGALWSFVNPSQTFVAVGSDLFFAFFLAQHLFFTSPFVPKTKTFSNTFRECSLAYGFRLICVSVIKPLGSCLNFFVVHRKFCFLFFYISICLSRTLHLVNIRRDLKTGSTCLVGNFLS